MWETEDEFVEAMVEAGCFIITGYDDDGDEQGIWDMELLSILYPAVYDALTEAMDEEVEQTLSDLTDKGLLTMGFEETDEGGIEEVWYVTDKGTEELKNRQLTDE